MSTSPTSPSLPTIPTSLPTKKFKEWTVQNDVLLFHCKLIKQLTTDNPSNDMQLANIYRSLFDFVTDPANNEYIKSPTVQGIILLKLFEIFKNPIFDRIKESVDRLYKIMSISQEEIYDMFKCIDNSCNNNKIN